MWSCIFVLSLAACAAAAPHELTKRTFTNLTSCLQTYSVPAIGPSSSNYTSAAQVYNTRLNFKPAVIVVPENVKQVSAAVKCANFYNLKVQAKGGGHSYAATSMGGTNGSLIVDMASFKTVTVDNSTLVATVGAGNRLGDVADALFTAGQRALPHGLCFGVGVAGHALHGGFGFTSRQWGVTLDVVTALEVVLADGRIVTATKTQYPDLFWALRGAGSSYGIVTSFKMQTQPAPANGVQYTYTFPIAKQMGAQERARVFYETQAFATVAPKELALRIFWDQMAFGVSGVYWGARENFEAAVKPLTDRWAAANLTMPTTRVVEAGWLKTLSAIYNNQPVKPPANYNKHQMFYTKSLVSTGEINQEALTTWFNWQANGTQPVSWYIIADLYGGGDSLISAKDPQSSSYDVRDGLFTFELYSLPKQGYYPDTGYSWMKDLAGTLTDAQPDMNWKSYVNYIDSEFTAQEAHRLYYPTHYKKLLGVKKKYDPLQRFWFPQAIGA